MKKENLFKGFLYSQLGTLMMMALGILIYGLIFVLYNLPMGGFFYGLILWGFFTLILLAVRYGRMKRQHRELQEHLRTIEYDWQMLPHSENPVLEDHREMIEALGKRCSELSTLRENERQESLDYYTTWVHQIKTPIAVMQMLVQTEDTEMNRALSAELFRVQQYVEMVLSYIRLGSSTHDYVFQEYELDELVRQSIRKFAPQFIRRKIGLNYEPAKVRALTDEKWLSFILEQLLSNAIKYTYTGSVTIQVTEDRKIRITDTGIGIAAEDLPRIFEKGFTGYNGRSDKKATGLGLYLVKQAADQMGIGVSVESEPGKGSTFTLDLSRRDFVVE